MTLSLDDFRAVDFVLRQALRHEQYPNCDGDTKATLEQAGRVLMRLAPNQEESNAVLRYFVKPPDKAS